MTAANRLKIEFLFLDLEACARWEVYRGPTMGGEAQVEEAQEPACCSPDEQRTCCDPVEKQECCGAASGSGCGCR